MGLNGHQGHPPLPNTAPCEVGPKVRARTWHPHPPRCPGLGRHRRRPAFWL